MAKKKIKRAAIISGGGAWGAFGAGRLAKLDKNYDIVAGISTGALMSGLVALRKWDILKEGYTSVTQNDIIDKKWYRPDPIKKDGKISYLSIIYALLTKKPTIGSSKAMRKTIKKFFTYEQYLELRNSNKIISVGCQNLKQIPSKVHYFDLKSQSEGEKGYEDFIDWMWASANAPFATSIFHKEWEDKNGNTHMGQWTDGGLTELVPLDAAIKHDADEIDVIIHRPLPVEELEIDEDVITLIDNFSTSFDAMRYDIEFERLLENVNELSNRGKKVTLYFLPRKLNNNAMVFDKNEMLSWWEEGYNDTHSKSENVLNQTKVKKILEKRKKDRKK